MRTYNKGNTQNVKKARKQSKELRKLKMANGSTTLLLERLMKLSKGYNTVIIMKMIILFTKENGDEYLFSTSKCE